MKTNNRQMKSAARLYAVQALFQMESSGQTTAAVEKEFEDFRFGATYEGDEMVEGDITTFRALVDRAVNEQARIDQMTDRALVAKWPIDRIDPTLRALFRAAGAELLAADTEDHVAHLEHAVGGGTLRHRRDRDLPRRGGHHPIAVHPASCPGGAQVPVVGGSLRNRLTTGQVGRLGAGGGRTEREREGRQQEPA